MKPALSLFPVRASNGEKTCDIYLELPTVIVWSVLACPPVVP